MIINKQELVEAVRPVDQRAFFRFLETKIDQVLKYPPLLPYDITTHFGSLKIVDKDHIRFNNIAVQIT